MELHHRRLGVGADQRSGRLGAEGEAEEGLDRGVVQLPGQPCSLLAHAQLSTGLEQAGLLHGHGGVGGEQTEQPLVGFAEAVTVALVGQVERTDDVAFEHDGHSQERSHVGMGRWPPGEARIDGHVVTAVGDGVDQQRAEQAVGAGQRADGVDEFVAHAGGDEPAEAVALGIGRAQRGVGGPDQVTGRAHQVPEHSVEGTLAGHAEDGLADRRQGCLGDELPGPPWRWPRV